MADPRPRDQFAAASSLVSVLMGGAFILESIGIPPLLTTAYFYLYDTVPPRYFTLAIGASGTFLVMYSVFFVIFISPIQCVREESIPENDFDFTQITNIDFLIVWLMFGTYGLTLVLLDIPINTSTLVGGFIVIVTSIFFRLIPKQVYAIVEKDCFTGIRVVIISVPLSIAIFIPTMIFVAEIFS